MYFALQGLFNYWVTLSRANTKVPSLGKNSCTKASLCHFSIRLPFPASFLSMTGSIVVFTYSVLYVQVRGQLFRTSPLRHGTRVFRVIFKTAFFKE